MMASGPSVALDDLDLLRTGSLDSGANTLLDPSACSDTLSFESFRHDSGSGEGALVALRDGDGERLCPPSSEIDVDRACALADRPHLTFRHGETAALGCELRPAIGRDDDIVRFAPQAKLGRPRRPFLRPKLFRAGRPPPTWAETRANPLANISCATEWDARSSMT